MSDKKREMHIYTEAGLECELAHAITGTDTRAAGDLMKYFHERMDKGLPYDEGILHRWMKHVFCQIVAAKKSPDIAFGLKLERGKHLRPDTTSRDITAAARMELGRRKKRRGDSKKDWSETKGDVANALFPDGTGEKAVEAADAEYREIFQLMTDEMLESISRKPKAE